MIKKSRQKFKYLENEKSFQDEIKSIFHHFGRAIIEANQKNFLEGESPTLTNSRGKSHEKKFRGSKLRLKLGFLPFSQGCLIGFTMSNI